jgi:release factor glutamine methyltransferase
MRVANNTVGSVLDLYGAELHARYGNAEARAIARTLFQELFGWDVAQLNDKRASELSESELLKVYLPLRRLREGEPLHYVLGHAWFMGMRLQVSPAVLIPRPETEELVDHIGKRDRVFQRIADIGTGSGCIAIALHRMYPEAEVFGLDISEEALRIAGANASVFDVQVEWQRYDVLDPTTPLPAACDLVVSNPPYIPRGEELSLAEHVRDHEPHIALFVDNADPLLFYRAIALKAQQALVFGGELWFEAHFQHAHAVGELLRAMAFVDVRVFNDLSGSPRFIHGIR